MSFKDKVLDIVRNIPEGETLSYSDVAIKAGSPKAARAVGTIMKNNYDKSVPCHRVIKANGEIGQYNRGGETAKKTILVFEKANKEIVNLIHDSDLTQDKKDELLKSKPKL